MRKNVFFNLITIFCILPTVLCGCSTIKEMGKGFAGVSTKVLEDDRPDALKKSYPLDYSACLAKVKDILKKDEEAYIYSQDPQNKMLALYVSETDTTPVGIFFTEAGKEKTVIEISSPSTYAKELVAKKIFTVMDKFFKTTAAPEASGLSSDNQDQPLEGSGIGSNEKNNMLEQSGLVSHNQSQSLVSSGLASSNKDLPLTGSGLGSNSQKQTAIDGSDSGN